MNQLLDSDAYPDQDRLNEDREISLGVPTILGIFFALALVCAGFFGFGYSLGRKSGQNAGAPSLSSSSQMGGAMTAKPSAGSVTGQPMPPPMPAASMQTVVAQTDGARNASRNGLTPADGMIVGDKPATGSQQAPPGNFMVQIAAVSSQDIADIELAALKKYGYEVAVHHEPQDQLLHIQIGPFAARKDAEAMRQNVLSHGFNAIVK